LFLEWPHQGGIKKAGLNGRPAFGIFIAKHGVILMHEASCKVTVGNHGSQRHVWAARIISVPPGKDPLPKTSEEFAKPPSNRKPN
jgi:hypothetical protein